MKKCPYCAEKIQDEAIICKHCHSDLKTGKPATTEKIVIQSPTPSSEVRAKSGIMDGVKIGFGMFIVLPLIAIVVLSFLYNSMEQNILGLQIKIFVLTAIVGLAMIAVLYLVRLALPVHLRKYLPLIAILVLLILLMIAQFSGLLDPNRGINAKGVQGAKGMEY